jgi:MarR family protein
VPNDNEVPGLPPEHQLLAGLARLGQAIRMEAWRNSGPHNLSPLQADIITYLDEDARPHRQGEIVAALASTPPTVSDAVKVLRAKGLVAGSLRAPAWRAPRRPAAAFRDREPYGCARRR